MNKRKIIIILSIICVIILCIVGSKLIHKKTENEVVDVSVKATSDRIDSEKYNIINGNIYYIYNEDAEF